MMITMFGGVLPDALDATAFKGVLVDDETLNRAGGVCHSLKQTLAEADRLCGLDPVWPETVEGEFISSAEFLADGQQAAL